MTDNPFKKIAIESVNKIDKVERSITALEKYLSQAAEALNESIEGKFNVTLKTTYTQGTINSSDIFTISVFDGNPKTKFIFLANDFHSKVIATINFDENGDDMSLSINKLKSTYSTTDEGFISCIGSIISKANIIEWAVKLRRNMTL